MENSDRIHNPRRFGHAIDMGGKPLTTLPDTEWRPGTGEGIMTVRGVRVQYGWIPATGHKCYYNLDTDMFMSYDEFETLCGRR